MRESRLTRAIRSKPVRQWFTFGWLAAVSVAALCAAPDDDIAVRVQRAGPEIFVDVDCPVRAPLPMAWAVLTDYEHMPRFISNIESSNVVRNDDTHLTVTQKGRVSRGLFTFAFETIRDVELVPYSEIRSRLIGGDMKASTFATRFVDSGGVVHVVNSGRYTPTMWVPPLIGPALIEAETRKQFGEIRAEIIRRSEVTRPASLVAPPRMQSAVGEPLPAHTPVTGAVWTTSPARGN